MIRPVSKHKINDEKDYDVNVVLFQLFNNGEALRAFAEKHLREEKDLDPKLMRLENKLKKQQEYEDRQARKKCYRATDEEILATYKEGGSLLTMAKRIGISTTQLIAKGERLGVYPRPVDKKQPKKYIPKGRVHKINADEFRKLLEKGPMSWRALSVHFDVSVECVIATAKRLKIKKVDMNSLSIKLTKAQLQKALEKKRSWKTISMDLGVSIAYLLKKAKEWGLKKEKMKSGAKRKPTNQVYNQDMNQDE